MALQLRRGTDAERSTITPVEGEPLWTTDTHVLYVGDGVTPGGIEISGGGGGGGSTGDIGFQGTWIRNTGTGDIYISPQDGNTGVYFPSDTNAGGSAVELFNVDTTGTVRIDAGSKNWTFSHDGSLSVPGNIDGAEGYTANMTGFRAGWYGGTSGYSFKSDGAQDTGMFSWGDGDLRLRANSDDILQITTAQAQFNTDVLMNATNLKFGTSTISAGAFNDIVINVSDSAVRLNGDQGVIVGDGVGSSQIDVNQITGISGGPVNIATVLKVGDGSSNSYITSRGDWPLILQTSDNNGPGASIVLSSGEYGTVELFAGNNQETQLANFNTGTGATIFLPTTIDGQLTLISDNPSEWPNAVPVLPKIYNDDSGSMTEVIQTRRFRGTPETPASVQQGDEIFKIDSLPYTGAWADRSVFPWIEGSPTEYYSFGGQIREVADQNFGDAPLYWNHLKSQYDFQSFNVPEPEHGSVEEVSYHLYLQGNTIGTYNFEIGGSFGGLASQVKLAPTKSDGFTEVVFTADGETETFTAPKIQTTGMMTLAVYTATALNAITGSIGQVAIVSDSAGGGNPNGMMAFWDTTNSRWSYVHDNHAV